MSHSNICCDNFFYVQLYIVNSTTLKKTGWDKVIMLMYVHCMYTVHTSVPSTGDTQKKLLFLLWKGFADISPKKQ